MISKYKDTITGAILIIGSIFVFIASYSIKSIGVSNVGARFFPQMCSVAIFILASILVLQDIKRNKGVKDNALIREGNMQQAKNLVFSYGVLFLSILFLRPLGFLISANFYLISNFIFLTPKEKRNYLFIILFSILTSNVIYWTFLKVFRVMLPSGIIG